MLEAGWRSGSLNTAHHASDAGRPVGAVPGPVTSAASAGCHKLIREGNAVLVASADDMAELVGPIQADPDESHARENTRVLDALSVTAPRSPDDVAARAGLSVAEAQSELARLEIEGVVRAGDRGWTKRGASRERP